MKCDSCLHSRTIVSENGFHSICCLSDKDALECLKSGEFYVEHPRYKEHENDRTDETN